MPPTAAASFTQGCIGREEGVSIQSMIGNNIPHQMWAQIGSRANVPPLDLSKYRGIEEVFLSPVKESTLLGILPSLHVEPP